MNNLDSICDYLSSLDVGEKKLIISLSSDNDIVIDAHELPDRGLLKDHENWLVRATASAVIRRFDASTMSFVLSKKDISERLVDTVMEKASRMLDTVIQTKAPRQTNMYKNSHDFFYRFKYNIVNDMYLIVDYFYKIEGLPKQERTAHLKNIEELIKVLMARHHYNGKKR